MVANKPSEQERLHVELRLREQLSRLAGRDADTTASVPAPARKPAAGPPGPELLRQNQTSGHSGCSGRLQSDEGNHLHGSGARWR